jgi:hypothetical protein
VAAGAVVEPPLLPVAAGAVAEPPFPPVALDAVILQAGANIQHYMDQEEVIQCMELLLLFRFFYK